MASDGVTGTLAFAQIERDERQIPFDPPIDELMAALVPGTSVERHNRTWHMGQVTRRDGYVFGRIGFQSDGSPVELWNEERQDFEESIVPSGVTSPFAIRLADLRITFQLRSGSIKHRSFTAAFQALLREASQSFWRVSLISNEIDFDAWKRTVDRVTTLRLRLEMPNPHFGQRHLIEELVEGTGSQMAQVVLKADKEDLDGLNVDSTFVTQAIEHAQRYGKVAAVGERQEDGETETVVYDGSGEIGDRVVSADAETGEVGQTELQHELEERGGDEDAGVAPDET